MNQTHTLPKTLLLLLASCSIVFVILFDFAMTSIASLYIIGELGSSFQIASYTVTFFGLGNMISIPLGYGLYTKFGTRRLILFFLFFFGISSVFSGFSQNFSVFIFGRFLQGFFGGPLFVLMSIFFRNFSDETAKKRFFPYVLFTFITAPTIGAAVGGFLAYFFSWRIIFYLNAFFIFAVFSVYLLLTRQETTCSLRPFDIKGYISFCGMALGLGLFAILGQWLDWFNSLLLTICFVVGIVSGLFFFVHTLYFKSLLFRFALLRFPLKGLAYFLLLVIFSCYFGMLILLSLWLRIYVNYSSIWVAFTLAGMAFATLLLFYAISLSQRKLRLTTLLLALALLIISSYMSTRFNEDVNLARLVIVRILEGFALSLAFPPIVFLLIDGLEEDEERYEMFTLFQIGRVVASTFGAALYVTLWQRRYIFYHSRFTETLHPFFSANFSNYIHKAKSFGIHGRALFDELNSLIERQGESLALNDCYFLFTWVLAITCIITLITLIKVRIQRYHTQKTCK